MSSNSAHMTYQWLGNWGAEKKGKQGEKENVVYFLVEIHVDRDNKTFALQLCNKVILGDSSTSNLELCFLLSQITVAEILNRKLSWSYLVQ